MNLSTPNVLIIDDDPGVLFLHKIIVREGNLCKNPLTFSEAENALEFILTIDAESSKILIFLDINMPKVDGWKFLEMLEEKVKQADIRVVMVTSSLSIVEREKANGFSPVIDYWEKPMNESQLIKLKENLGNWLE
ncbi:response regulator [Algoriphagus litoralis]|uniref:response regulator n=1 Tax=Algoriphagus litoralis TaxID=2202829 RepID=UPI000DBA82D2|nr:response regulator [Algoriphagus litoralis]